MYGYIGGEYILNPDIKQREESKLYLTLAGTREKIVMIEAEASELTNKEMLDAIKFGHKEIISMCDFLENIRKEIGKEKFDINSEDIKLEQLSSEAITYSKIKKGRATLANEILKDLPKTLDDGAYIDNATVIRRMSTTLEMNEVLVKIPRLIGKHLIAIYSKGTKLKKALSTVVDDIELLDGNNNFPHLVLPTTNGDSHKLYALTYCDKLVELSIDEYRLINTQLYKVGVEGRSLIKAFISYHAMKYEHEAYLLMPTYVAESNAFYELLQDKIDEHVIIPHKELNLNQVRKFQKQNDIYFLGTELCFKELKGNHKFPEVIFSDTDESLYILLEGWNQFTLNTMLTVEVERILLDVRLFYVHRLGELQKKLERFNKDIVSVSDEEIKEEIQVYRNKLRDYISTIQVKFNDFDKAYHTIIKNVDSKDLIKEIIKLVLNNADKFIGSER